MRYIMQDDHDEDEQRGQECIDKSYDTTIRSIIPNLIDKNIAQEKEKERKEKKGKLNRFKSQQNNSHEYNERRRKRKSIQQVCNNNLPITRPCELLI